MGTVPTPPTFTAGATLTAAQQNSLRDSINFLMSPPQCLAYASAAQSTATNTYVAIALDAEAVDVVQSGDTPMHDNVTSNTRIYARTAGKYEVSGECSWISNATGNFRAAQVRVNAAANVASGTGLMFVAVQTVNGTATDVVLPIVTFQFSAGDYIEMFGNQTSGAGLALQTGIATTFLRMKWVGV